MKDNYFLDTNLLIYCYSDNEPEKQEIARNIANTPEAIISTQVIQEFTNAMTKKFGVSWVQAEQSVLELSEDFLIHTNATSTLRLACQIANRYKFHFYDSLIIAAALESSCTILYSEDMQNLQVIENQLTIINPFNQITS